MTKGRVNKALAESDDWVFHLLNYSHAEVGGKAIGLLNFLAVGQTAPTDRWRTMMQLTSKLEVRTWSQMGGSPHVMSLFKWPLPGMAKSRWPGSVG
jgi:hypothetical protein